MITRILSTALISARQRVRRLDWLKVLLPSRYIECYSGAVANQRNQQDASIDHPVSRILSLVSISTPRATLTDRAPNHSPAGMPRLRFAIPRFLPSLCFAICLMSTGGASYAAPARPNIVIIVADDLGYTDLGCFGSEISTPHLDRLAAAGVTFTNFYTAPTCSPTRAMLLTGVDHHRTGLGNMYEFLRSAPQQIGKPGYEGYLNQRVVTIPEVLQRQGYHTSIAGKWHVGRRKIHSPAARGFNRSWVLVDGWSEHYYPNSTTSSRRLFRADGMLVEYPRGRYSSEWYTDKAIEFVDEAIANEQPFFLVTSYTAPHWPLEAPPDAIRRQAGKYDIGYEAIRRQRMRGLQRKGIVPAGTNAAPAPIV